MTQRTTMKLIPALLLVAFSGTASASGFQLLEQNLSGLGNAYAGSAAVAENASTIYFNPAGMTQLQDREVSGGLAAIGPSFKFEDKGSDVGALAGTGDGGDAGGWAAVPNGYISWALTKDLYVGLGVGAPFGLKTEYDDRWVGAAQSIMFDLKTFNINPSIAFRVNDKVSIGGGLNWQRVEAEYVRAAGITALGGGAVDFSHVISTMNLKDSAWGWNVGALFTLSPATKVGISYRSRIKYDTTGDVKVASDGDPTGDAAMGFVPAGSASNLKASLTMPDTAILSVSQKLDSRWEMLGDISWTGWSSIPKVDIMRTSGVLIGNKAQTLGTDFKDAWRVALGANYMLNDAWKLKFGVAYDQTPVKAASSRLTAMPDNDRVWLSFGAQWAPSKTSKLDLGATYIHVRDTNTNNDQTTGEASPRGVVTGDYTGNIWVLGAQYSMSF